MAAIVAAAVAAPRRCDAPCRCASLLRQQIPIPLDPHHKRERTEKILRIRLQKGLKAK
jgi:hypothetical protein